MRILDFVDRVGTAGGSTLTKELAPSPDDRRVHFAKGQSALLAETRPNAQAYQRVLGLFQSIKHPVFVDVDDDVIVNLRVPVVGQVARLRRVSGGRYLIGLNTSAARYVLRPQHPQFTTLVDELREAKKEGTPLVLVATDDRHVVKHIQRDDASLNWFTPLDFIKHPVLGNAATAQASEVSQTRAKALFEGLSSQSCRLPAGKDGCLALLYPDDGCWAVAAQACKILADVGLTAVKVWLHGDLRGETANSPVCEVFFGFHVAPALRVGSGKNARLMVLDAMFFERPVSLATWKAAFGDADAAVSVTEAVVFSQGTKGQFGTEPEGQLEFDLDAFKGKLELRASDEGPPPYDDCDL